jgi:hypothetical protein
VLARRRSACRIISRASRATLTTMLLLPLTLMMMRRSCVALPLISAHALTQSVYFHIPALTSVPKVYPASSHPSHSPQVSIVSVTIDQFLRHVESVAFLSSLRRRDARYRTPTVPVAAALLRSSGRRAADDTALWISDRCSRQTTNATYRDR